MDYKTYKPGKELSTLIKCYWTLEADAEEKPQKQRIVPDGCVEMIFNHGDLYRQYLDESNSIVQPRCFVIGQLTEPLYIEPTGKTGIFSARFYPGGFMPFATMPIKQMENKAVSLQQLFSGDGITLEQNILHAETSADKITIVENFLTSRLTNIETIDRILKSTVETIVSVNGQISVGELSQQMNINRRQLERKFSSTTGLSPRQLAKIVRLQAAFKMLLNNQFTSLTSLAYEGDYYDQAHFIKDFKEFTGLTPKKFYSDNLQMSSLFYGSE
ncbi:MAG: helix-turn-helix domain-containing protein [Bacteroidota bacterium]